MRPLALLHEPQPLNWRKRKPPYRGLHGTVITISAIYSVSTACGGGYGVVNGLRFGTPLEVLTTLPGAGVIASPPVWHVHLHPIASSSSGHEVFGSLSKGTKRALELADAGKWDSSLTLFHQALAKELGSRSKRSNSSALVKDCNRFLRSLKCPQYINRAMAVYRTMVDAGLEPTIVTYTILISRAGKLGRMKVAEDIYADMLRRGRVKPDVQLLNSLINVFVKCGALKKAYTSFKDMVDQGLVPSLITFHCLMDGSAKIGDTKMVEDLVNIVQNRGLSPNERTYSILINAHARKGDVDAAFHALQEMESRGIAPNAFTYGSLINACAKSGRLDQGLKVMDRMRKQQNLTPGVVPYTSLIETCCRIGDLETGFSLLRKMIWQDGVQLNAITCSVLINGCGRKGEIDAALQVLRFMLDSGLKPSKVVYTSLLTACAKFRRDDCAVMVVHEMQRNIMANKGKRETMKMGRISSLESNLLCLFCNIGRIQEAITLFEGMIERSLFLDKRLVRDLFSSIQTGRHVDDILKVLQRVLASGHSAAAAAVINNPDEDTYIPLLCACGRTNRIKSAFLILKIMQEHGPEPTDASLIALIKSLQERGTGRFDTTLEVFQAIRDSGLIPLSSRSYASVLHMASKEVQRNMVYKSSSRGGGGGTFNNEFPISDNRGTASQGNLFKLFLLFKEMQSQGISPDLTAFNALINSCASVGDMERAIKVAQAMVREHGIKPDIITYTSFVKAAGRGGQVDAAENIFKSIKRIVNPTEHTYKHLMVANIKAERFKRVFELWLELINQGITPTLRSYSQMLFACQGAGDIDRALHLYQHMKARSLRMDNRCLLSLVKLCKACGRHDQACLLMRQTSATTRET